MLSAAGTVILASCVLGMVGLTLAAVAAVACRRHGYGPVQSLILAWSYVMTRVLWRTDVSGRLLVSPGHGAVIVCNHRCPVDPAFIALAADRMVHWMVAREYCVHLLTGRFLRACEVIPTNRAGIDTAATKLAMRYAQQGGLVGLLPEGRINTTRQTLLPGRPGAAMIALKAQVPVIPCHISGSPYNGTTLGCLLMPAKVRLTIGRPIDISPYYGRENDREVLELLTRRFLKEIADLGGDVDYQPQLAGRFYKPGMSGDAVIQASRESANRDPSEETRADRKGI